MNRLSLTMAGVSAEALLAERPRETDGRRTNQRVRAGSRYPGDQLRPSPISRKEAGRRKKALRVEAQRRRVAGRRAGGRWKDGELGTISHYDVAVYEVLVDWAAGHGGLAELAVSAIARFANCCAETVHRAKRKLKALGLLDWIRQCEPTGQAGRRGPQVQQIANHYLLPVPPWAQALFDRWWGPTPDDELARKAAMVAQLMAHDRADQEALSPAIARAQAKADQEVAARACEPPD
ncbi:MAG: hypothetical protein P4L73_20695 [Caulobacteraceae bacterium]|nr:hypothetical protein [Caulobacteraceae bacterium]